MSRFPPLLPVGVLLVALVSPVPHHLVVPHGRGGAGDLHASQADPVGKEGTLGIQPGGKKADDRCTGPARKGQPVLSAKNNY